MRSPIETISEGSTSLRIESSRLGMTPFGLEADVEEDFVVVDLDHGADDQVTVVEFEDAVADEGREVGADQVVFGDDARNVVSVFVKGAHLLGGEEACAVRHEYVFRATTPGSD